MHISCSIEPLQHQQSLLLFLLSALLKVFEVAEGNDKLTRLNTAKDITETVKSLQQFAMIRHHFKRWDRQTLTH